MSDRNPIIMFNALWLKPEGGDEMYKEYLKARLAQMPRKGWGARGKLAKAIPCQVGYVSQVLNGEAHFSLEQCYAINNYLAHSEEEGHFFLLLTQLGRAESHPIREYFQKQIDELNRLVEQQHQQIDELKSRRMVMPS